MATSVSDSRIAADRADEARRVATGDDASVRDDRTLVIDFKSGAPDAYAEIYRRYHGLARHICLRMLRNADDADEAVQETMIRVFQGLPRFNGRYALQPWVARIATNVALDALRARARRPQNGDPLHEFVEDGERAGGQDPGELVERILEGDRVKATLADLPVHHREALMLRDFEGRSHQEIGDALGVSPSQAKALIHRARLSFRRVWVGENGERRGIAVVLPAFLLPSRLFPFLRRAADRASEAGQAAAASPALSAAASSPALATAATQTSDRVVAAAVTLLLAGSVGLGAVAVTHNRDEAKPKAVVAAPAAPAREDTQPVAGPALDERTVKGGDREIGPPIVAEPPGDETASPGPTTDPSVVPPVDSPSPPPSGSPSPDPPPTTEPMPPPAWTGSFLALHSSEDLCGCGAGPELVSSAVTGDLGTRLDFAQSLGGAALDNEGDAAWALTARYWGWLRGEAASLGLTFSLTNANGTYEYSGAASFLSRTGGDGEPVVYTLSGLYYLDGGPEIDGPIPAGGSFLVELSIWEDGTSLYRARIAVQA